MSATTVAYTLFLVLATVWGGQPTPAGEQALSSASHYTRGAELARSGKLTPALAELEKAAKAEPDNPKVHNLVGVVLSQLGRLKEADEAYNRALALAPDFYPARKNRASNAFFQRSWKFAAAEFDALARIQPGDFVPELFLGLLAIENADLPRARARLLQARQLAPGEGRVLLALTRVHLMLGEREQAIATAREMLANSNARFAERFELGVLLARFEANAEGAEVFEDLWRRKPGSYDVGFNLALLEHRSGQREAARATVEELISRGARKAEIWNLRGWIYHRLNRPDVATASFQRAIAAEPAAADHYLDLSTVLIDVGDLESAGRVIAEGMGKCTEKDRLYVQLGQLRKRSNDPGQAEKYYRAALELNPDNEAAYVALAHLLLVAEREEEASVLLQTALRHLPDSPLLNYIHGALLMETAGPEDTAQLERARLVLEKALRLNPLFANTHYRLGKLYLIQGDEQSALGHLERACALNPKHTKALYQLSRVLAQRGEAARAAEVSQAVRQLLQEKYQLIQEQFADLLEEKQRRARSEVVSAPPK